MTAPLTPTPLTPTDDIQLTEAIRQALADNTLLEVVGAGSKRGWGRPVSAGRVLSTRALTGVTGKEASELPPFPAAPLLDLSALTGVVAYEPAELAVSVRPGTPVSAVELLLAGDHQYFAFEPPDLGPLLGQPAGQGTLGGLLACNLSGPGRLKAGPLRGHILGLKAVSGRGEGIQSGGGSQSGFDVSRLLAGSFGTLAVLTEVTLRVLPRPETECTVLLTGLDEATAVRALTIALHGPHEISGAAYLPVELAALSAVPRIAAAGQSVTVLRIEGFERSVAARMARLPGDLADYGGLEELPAEASRWLWREIAGVHPFVVRKERLVWRLSLPPAAAAGAVAALRRTLVADAVYDWGGGLVWLGVEAGSAGGDAGTAAIRAALAPLDGAEAMLVRAPEAVRRGVEVFPPLSEAQSALAARVKSRFDPGRILNRGRMYRKL